MSRIERWLLEPAPAPRLAVLRVLVGGYAVIRLVSTGPSLVQFARLPSVQFAPVGVLAWLPDRLPPGVVVVALVAAVATGLAFIAGLGWRFTGFAFALLFFLLSTYRMSWGHVSHADHLPAWHLLVLAIAPAAEAWSLDARRRRRAPPDAEARFGWPVRVMALLTVVTYVLAGIAKLRPGGWDWLTGDVLRNQITTDALQKTLLGAAHSPLSGWFASHSALLVPAALFAVVIELGAPVALLGGRWRDAWVASAWLFHVGIAAVMAIAFPYPLCLVAFAPFYAVERPVLSVRAWFGNSAFRNRSSNSRVSAR